jgi:hypothetical protein
MIIRRQNGRVFYNLSMNMVVGILMNFSLVMRSKNTDLGSGLYLWRGRGGGGGGVAPKRKGLGEQNFE